MPFRDNIAQGRTTGSEHNSQQDLDGRWWEEDETEEGSA